MFCLHVVDACIVWFPVGVTAFRFFSFFHSVFSRKKRFFFYSYNALIEDSRECTIVLRFLQCLQSTKNPSISCFSGLLDAVCARIKKFGGQLA